MFADDTPAPTPGPNLHASSQLKHSVGQYTRPEHMQLNFTISQQLLNMFYFNYTSKETYSLT